MTEDLPHDQQGLFGHRPRRPEMPGDPIRLSRSLGESGEDSLASVTMLVEAPAHETSVVGDRIAVTGEQLVERHRRRPPKVAEILDPRART